MNDESISMPVMRHYRCYYARFSPFVGLGSQAVLDLYNRGVRWPQQDEMPFEITADPPQLFAVGRLGETHILVRELEAPSLDAVYHRMQVETMKSQEFTAFSDEIQAKGLTHTSMSAGDVIEDINEGVFYECDVMGWRRLDP